MGKLKAHTFKVVVLDEADTLLDRESLESVRKYCPGGATGSSDVVCFCNGTTPKFRGSRGSGAESCRDSNGNRADQPEYLSTFSRV